MHTRRKGAHRRNYAVGSEVAENGKWKSSLAVYRLRYNVEILFTVYTVNIKPYISVYGILDPGELPRTHLKPFRSGEFGGTTIFFGLLQ